MLIESLTKIYRIQSNLEHEVLRLDLVFSKTTYTTVHYLENVYYLVSGNSISVGAALFSPFPYIKITTSCARLHANPSKFGM